MLIEQLIFTIIAFSLFVAIFTKMILKNDTSYITILIIQTIGIVINFLEVLFQIKINTLLNFITRTLKKQPPCISLQKAKIFVRYGSIMLKSLINRLLS